MMFVSDMTVNMLTLAGLALAVGTLSDSAVVIVENITRHQTQLEKSKLEAAIDGANEMVGSMITATLTNIASSKQRARFNRFDGRFGKFLHF